MGKAQKEWARKTRDSLREELGGECIECGSRHNLEFDVIVPLAEEGKPKHHRRMDWSHRMSFYKAQHKLKNVALRCKPCNGRKGSTEDKNYHVARRKGGGNSSIIGAQIPQ